MNKEKNKFEKFFEEFSESTKGKVSLASEEIKKASIIVGDKADIMLDETIKTVKDTSNKAGKVAIELAKNAKNNFDELKYDLEKSTYRPVFKEDCFSNEFKYPEIINIVKENKHINSVACEGAIGYLPKISKSYIFEVIKENVDYLNLKFIPNSKGNFYVVDPYDCKTYINLNYYFEFLKKQRIAELFDIAYKLGAKHVVINLREQNKKYVSSETGFELKVKKSFKEKASNIYSIEDSSIIDMKYERTFEGSDKPERPQVKFYSGDPDVSSLIESIFDPKHKLYSASCIIKYETSSDIDVAFASEIDLILDKLNLGSNASIKGTVEKYKRCFFEYIIEF
ncbi:MAG: hypothetical protein MR210_03575 [Erysipelotrichaceae bacterium]|nr:hypothetical protein [Erysipelotrichaceae bacterium]MDY5251408.1 hypothetical protein [Erysipelotrichaceae bacterium]